jgi:ribonucleoside-triphosphate reductase
VEEVNKMTKCGMRCEVISRVVGYHRPISQWNKGKKEEFKLRKEFAEDKCMCSEFGNRGFPRSKMEMANNFTF